MDSDQSTRRNRHKTTHTVSPTSGSLWDWNLCGKGVQPLPNQFVWWKHIGSNNSKKWSPMNSNQSGLRHKQNTTKKQNNITNFWLPMGRRLVMDFKRYCVGMAWGECVLVNEHDTYLINLCWKNGSNIFENNHYKPNEFRPIGALTQTEDQHCITHFRLPMG